MALKTLYLQSGVFNAVDDRRLIGMLLNFIADPLSGNGRVLSGLNVAAQGVPDMTVAISTGRCVVPTPASDGGAYLVMNDASANLTVPAVSTQPRIDLVCVAVDDADYAGAVYTPKFVLVQGTPSASPVAPARPAGYLQLAQLSHAANATSVANSAITLGDLSSIHSCEYVHTTIQTIVSGGDRALAFDTPTYTTPDVTRGTATAGAQTNAKFTLNRTGLWTIDACCRLAGLTAGAQFGIWVGPDVGGTRYAANLHNSGGTANNDASVAFRRRFKAGDTIVAYYWQSSGANKSTDPLSGSNHIRLAWDPDQ
jgi:hypothetical protein